MTSPYDLFATSPTLETEGIELDYGPFQIRIARAGGSNRRYQQALERRLKPYRTAIDNGTLDNELGRRLLVESYADGIILGWKNVTDRDGKPLAFTHANCVKLLMDLPELFADIQEQASRFALFKDEEVKESADFLLGVSNGSLNGEPKPNTSKPSGPTASGSAPSTGGPH